MRQLHPQYRCLNRVHASVPAKFMMIIASRTAMIAQLPHMLCHRGTSRGDDACVSISAEVFRGIETEGCGDAERARAAPVPLRANRLRGVLNDGNAEFLRDAVECIHVGALSVKV